MEENGIVQKSVKWLEGLSKGTISHELEALALDGLQILHAQKGSIRSNFVVPSRASDPDGNWHVGAMATLIDDVGAAAIYSIYDHVKVSLDFNISFHSTAKIQEEVEIEAKVIGDKGKLCQVVVEVRRKGNGELIASAKQWMATHKDSISRKGSQARELTGQHLKSPSGFQAQLKHEASQSPHQTMIRYNQHSFQTCPTCQVLAAVASSLGHE